MLVNSTLSTEKTTLLVDMAKILVADDDQNLTAMISDYLRAQNHLVDVVDDGDEALEMLLTYTYDVAILDWVMPGTTGQTVCARYREKGGGTPILMLTALGDIEHKQKGFGGGADDYLTKPFDKRELLLRVTALLRRRPDRPTELIVIGKLSLDPRNHAVEVDGQSIDLTPREFALLEFFMRNPNTLFSADALMARVWESDSEASDDTVRVLINRVRKKISSFENIPRIKTVFGMGYKLET